MSAPPDDKDKAPPPGDNTPINKPYIPDEKSIPEFTWPSVLVGAVLGIIFGASSLYLLLKVGMTVSASVPIAVLSITLFRVFSRIFGFRRATILENNIVQTTGSAGESLAFGVGVTMPALLLLGFEMDWVRVMTVAVLGGLLGVLMMIPLRRAFIVKQHGKLKYPEGTACAEVLIAGEKGGSSAKMVFLGFGIAFVYKLLTAAFHLWPEEPGQNLFWKAGGRTEGLKGAALGGDLAPEMMGVGYLIGPRIACMMMAGAVLSFFVIGPLIATIGEGLNQPVAPAQSQIDEKTGEDKGLIRNMEPGDIYKYYLRYIGAGAVAAGGIISMCRALPLIVGSIVSGLRDLRSSTAGGPGAVRTERDMPMSVVVFGSLALVLALAAVPQLGLGLTLQGILGAIMILLFGFLFVTVSSRLTGEVGSSSNPISGMTIATLLLTCLIFVLVGRRDVSAMLTSLSVAGVVCIASSNGGTTSQDLKTGYLVGATPKFQQWAILVGALTSAIVIGGTMLVLNAGGTHYTNKGFANVVVPVPADAPRQKVGQPHESEDSKEYRVVYLSEGQVRGVPDSRRVEGVPDGWYLVDDEGHLSYKIDVPIKREAAFMDNGKKAPEPFKAPQPQLFALIIEGILGGKLQWGLVLTGALVAVAMELMGIGALPVAVGMYLGLSTATPIFLGGLLRWATDRWRGVSASEAETETSPGVLLSSGYIAGGTLCGLLIGFLIMAVASQVSIRGYHLPPDLMDTLNVGEQYVAKGWEDLTAAKWLSLGAFAVLAAILLWIGGRKETAPQDGPAERSVESEY
jgi:putative OPT family oligopeptide transporter